MGKKNMIENQKYNNEYIQRFWEKVDIQKTNNCWIWKGAKQSKGYGSVGLGNGKTGLAHRVAYEINSREEIQKNICVMHICDNRLCCNPNHLILGTIADNNHDMVHKKRQAQGEKNGRSKLTVSTVLDIKKAIRLGQKTMMQLAKEYGVHYNTVRYAAKGKNWKELPS